MKCFKKVPHVLFLLAVTALASTTALAAGKPSDCTPVNNQIVVAPAGGCSTIDAALAQATGTADSPIVIDVMPGTYTIPVDAPIVMKSHVTLRGAGREVTVLASDGIIMEVDNLTNVSISGFTFTNAGSPATGWGMLGSNLSNVTIADNTFTGQHIGMYLYYVNNLTIESNNIGASGGGGTPFGIIVDGGEPLRITNNAFMEPNAVAPLMTAISVSYSDDTTIEGNSFTDSNIGIELYSNVVSSVSGNKINGGTTYGIYVGLGTKSTIEGNSISGASTGVYLDSANTTLSGNTIAGSAVDGIECRARGGAGSPEIHGNVIKGNGRYGINVFFDSDPTISHNKITGNATSDVFIYNSNTTTPHISWNVIDTISGGVDGFGKFNLKSDGTDLLVP